MLDVWNFSSVLLMSTILRELNRRMFEDAETAGTQFLALFSGSLFNWSRALGSTHTISLPK